MSTTSNQRRRIATKGTKHRAQATSPDVCRVPGEAAPKPFDNYVDSTELQAGKTTTTFIAGQPVWTRAGELGPSSLPAHEGSDGGVNSGTYCDVATASSYSPDVFFEGEPVVRTDDTTLQNRGNTVGCVLEDYGAERTAGKGALPTQCGYLAGSDKVFTLDVSRAQWKRSLTKWSVNPTPTERAFTFRDGTSRDALEFAASVGGRTIPIIVSKGGKESTKPQPTVNQVTEALSTLDPSQSAAITQVVLDPNPKPGKPNTVADAGCGGVVTIFPNDAYADSGYVFSTMVHESGHSYACSLWKSYSHSDWEKAMKADGNFPSQYGKDAGGGEDFSESLVMYALAKGTPCEAWAKKLYPNRWAYLDKLLNPPPAKKP